MRKAENLDLLGANMVLEEAIKELRRSVHSCGCEEGKEGDEADGIELHQRISDHCDNIQSALDHWERCLRHRNSIKEKS